MPRAQSSQPTIKNNLKSNAQLQPTIRSNSAYSYDEARAGYVERPYGVGSQWEQLGRSLAAFDNSLVPFLQHRLDARIERQVAQGETELFQQWNNPNKNMLDWKTFVEENPQYAGDNPWLQKGFEQARLKSLGLQYHKELTDAYAASGLQNERDQKKVSGFVENFTQNFRKKAGLHSYADSLILAANYSPLEAQSKAAFYSQHSAHVRSETEKRTEQEYAALAMQALQNTFDPSLGGNYLGDPSMEAQNKADIIATINTITQEALNHGMLASKEGTFKANLLFNAYEQLGEKQLVLDLLGELKTSDGVALDSLDGVAQKRNSLIDRRESKRRSNLQFYWSMREHQEKEQKKHYLGAFLNSYLNAKDENGNFVNGVPTKEMMDAMGVPSHLQFDFLKQSAEYYAVRSKAYQNAPATQESLFDLALLAQTGSLSPQDCRRYASYIGADQASDLAEKALKAQDGDDKEWGTVLRRVAQNAYGKYSRDKKDPLSMIEQMTLGFDPGLNKEQKIGLDAARWAQHWMNNKRSEFEQSNKGIFPPTSQIAMWENEAMIEANKNVGAYLPNGEEVRATAPPSSTAATAPPPPPVKPDAPNPLSPRGAQPESGPPSSARHPAQQHNPIVEWFAVNYPGLNVAAFQNEKELMNWLREENYEKYMEISDLLSVWGYTMPVGGNK